MEPLAGSGRLNRGLSGGLALFFSVAAAFWSAFHSTPAEADGPLQAIVQRSYAPSRRTVIVRRSARVKENGGTASAWAGERRQGGPPGSTKPSVWDELIRRYSRMRRLDPHLVRAIIEVESAGNPEAVSPRGAAGLMQLMPATAARYGTPDLFDPEQNIASGTAYLRSLLDRYHSLELALWAYNAGPSAVTRGHVPRETRTYVPKVLELRHRYRTQSGG